MKTNVKTLSDLDLAIMLEDQFGTENLIRRHLEFGTLPD